MCSGKVCPLFVVVSVVSWAFVARAAAHAEMPSVTATAIERGQILQSQGKFSEAEREFQLAIRESGQSAGQADAQVDALSNLASVEIELGRLDEAARLYERGIALLLTRRAEDDHRVRNVRVQLAELYLEANQIVTAEKVVRSAIAHQPGRPGDRESAAALDVLACIYAHEKKLAAAENSERQALSIFESLADSDRAAFAIATLHMSLLLDLRKRPEDALPFATRALAMVRELAVPQPAMEAAAEISLASIYSRLHRRDEAEAASEAACRSAVQFYGPDHLKTAEILFARAAVLRTIGQKHAARQAQARGEAILLRDGSRGAMETVPALAWQP